MIPSLPIQKVLYSALNSSETILYSVMVTTKDIVQRPSESL